MSLIRDSDDVDRSLYRGVSATCRCLLEEWISATRPVPDTTLPALFEAQMMRSPEAAALSFEGTELSYGELNAKANRLARHLAGLGVGTEDIVGLCLERSLDMVVALLAVLKTGAGIDDNFFDLGGDSIQCIQLVGQARKSGLVATPRDVFQRRTVAAIAATASSPYIRGNFDPLPFPSPVLDQAVVQRLEARWGAK